MSTQEAALRRASNSVASGIVHSHAIRWPRKTIVADGDDFRGLYSRYTSVFSRGAVSQLARSSKKTHGLGTQVYVSALRGTDRGLTVTTGQANLGSSQPR